jgi:hypothetical protein
MLMKQFNADNMDQVFVKIAKGNKE